MITPSEALGRLCDGEDLSKAEVAELFGQLMDGEMSNIEKSALLVALRMKGETPAEIAGAAVAMRQRVIAVEHRCPEVVDTCGTGGDGSGTFNISTAAALVAAAGGATVAKHGNRSVSSRSGSADVLSALGLDKILGPREAGRCLAEVGIAFLFAPRFHPAMREVMPVRRALALRTVFNVLGPLTNPAGAHCQLVGVYQESLVEVVARVLADLGSRHALVVHGDGLDEITTTGETLIGEVRDGGVTLARWTPEKLGTAAVAKSDLAGGEPQENAAVMERLLQGEAGPLAEITAVNAGAALYVGGRAETLVDGIAAARRLLAEGTAWERLEALRRFTASAEEDV
ncbi:MAG: anthranilate phosphoribosyltransferase [Acidobacteriota bacterium]